MLNKSPVEQNFTAFNAILTLLTFNVSNHNGTILADHFMAPQSFPSALYLTNQFLIAI